MPTTRLPFVKKISPTARMKLCTMLTGRTLADCYIHLNIDPHIAMQRVNNRAKQKGVQKNGHENIEDLTCLAQEYHELFKALRHLGPETTTIPANLSAKQVSAAALSFITTKVRRKQLHTIHYQDSGQLHLPTIANSSTPTV